MNLQQVIILAMQYIRVLVLGLLL